MLSDDKILGLWAEGRQQAPARPVLGIRKVLGSRKVVAFARAVERAAYERAASLCDKADKSAHPSDLADAIRALGRQHD